MTYEEIVTARGSCFSYFHFDALAGVTEIDHGFVGKNGTYSGDFILQEPGQNKALKSVQFNPTLNTGKLEINPGSEVKNTFSVEILFKSNAALEQAFVHSGITAPFGTFIRTLGFGNAFNVNIGDGAKNLTVGLTTGEKYPPGSWYLVTLTVSKTTGKLYVWGVQDGEAAWAEATPILVDGAHLMTYGNNGGTRPTKGWLSQASLYTSVLTPAEILKGAEALLTAGVRPPVPVGSGYFYFNSETA